MIPAEASAGRSFKGAAAYYLHDKREAGEVERTTSDRVAWTLAVNLPTEDPERAWRMMVHTATAQADLKAAAGVKATGRKLTKPVYAYSLSWHPDEQPTREQQIEAARETLKTLGLEQHQALIVCHRDEPHAHVHIVVNRVDPQTGIAAPLKNSRLKLSNWALAYEEKQGKIVCPARAENHKRRQQGEKVDAGRKPRAAYEADKGTANDNLTAAFVKSEQRQKDAQLYATGRQMQASHRRQWQAVHATYAALKERLRQGVRQQKDRKATEVKAVARPRWRVLFQDQKQARQAFEAAERGTLSKLMNIANLWDTTKAERPEQGRVVMFLSLLSSSQRRATFERSLENQRRALSQAINGEVRIAHKAIDRHAARDFEKLRREFTGQCDVLRQEHDKQEAALKGMWEARNRNRREALAPFVERARDMRQGYERSRGRTIQNDDRYRPRSRKPEAS